MAIWESEGNLRDLEWIVAIPIKQELWGSHLIIIKLVLTSYLTPRSKNAGESTPVWARGVGKQHICEMWNKNTLHFILSQKSGHLSRCGHLSLYLHNNSFFDV